MWEGIKGQRIVGMRLGETEYSGVKELTLLLENGNKVVINIQDTHDDSWLEWKVQLPPAMENWPYSLEGEDK